MVVIDSTIANLDEACNEVKLVKLIVIIDIEFTRCKLDLFITMDSITFSFVVDKGGCVWKILVK